MRGRIVWFGGLIGAVALAAAPAAHAALPAACDPARPAVAYDAGDLTAGVPAGTQLVPCRYATGARAMEPSLGFTPDGRLFYQGWELQKGSVNGAPLRPVVKRSSGDYTHWVDVTPPQPGPVTSLDPFLTVDHRTGRVFSVNFLGNGQENCATVSFTDNGGDSWTSSPAACNGFDGESLGVGPPATTKLSGYPDLVYYCTGTTPASSQPTTTPICSKSTDGGLTFVPTGALPWPLVDPSAENDKFGPWAGNPIVGPDGTVYIPKRFAGQPEVAISHDEGASWTHAPVANNGSSGETPRMAVDGDGNVFIAWTDEHHLPFLASSRDRGKTWSAPVPLAPPGLKEAALPRPATAGNGRVAVAYLGSTNATGAAPYYDYCNYLLSPCDDGTYAKVAWNGYLTVVDNAFAAQPALQTATVDPPDRPLFTGGCSADGACKADLDFVDAAIGPDGDAYGAFVDDCALTRDFTPAFGQDFGPCADNLGEGIVARLTPYTPAHICASRRELVVHVRPHLRRAAVSFSVIVAGRTVARRVPARRGARIVLRGRPRGAVSVLLVVRLRSLRLVRDRRTYHPCVHRA